MAAKNNTPFLELQNISVYYGNVLALENVSLHVNTGEIVCLLGGNASGKTTTMKTILSLVAPKSGRILIKGKDMTGASTKDVIQCGVAMVPENRELFPGISVRENLLLGAYLRKNKNEISADMQYVFSLFPKIKERLNQKAGTLSGGEQQMVAVGRALMSRPDFILMDEPSMGLSPLLVKQSFEMIQKLHDEGKTVFVVEQNANISLAIADRGYVLQTGKIVLSGQASQLASDARLQHAYLGNSSNSNSIT